jgi:dTDP-4-amino-4,6-dideoxygalactose transaminase
MPGPGYYWSGEEEEREVLEVIRGGHLFRYGSPDDPSFKHKVIDLEESVKAQFGVNYALAVSSGTAALVVSMVAAGIGPGDEVICPGYTFIASMSAIIFTGAVPVLAEIDDSLTLDPRDVEKKISPKTKAILAVHMIGNPCDLDDLKAIAKKHKLLLIEDAAQAFGGRYKGKALGTIGDIGIYSFNIYKTINAGDGGMVVTNNEEMYNTAFSYHDQGHMPLRMGIEIGKRSIIGLNFRMNELTGAYVLAQFRKLDHLLAGLHRVKDAYKKRLENKPGIAFRRLNDPAGECATLLTVLLPSKEIAAKVCAELGTKTVSQSGWHVYNLMEQILEKKQLNAGPPYRSTEFPTDVEYHAGMLPKTDDLLSRAINISIGVIDAGLGSGFGVNPHSTEEEIAEKAEKFIAAVAKHLKP